MNREKWHEGVVETVACLSTTWYRGKVSTHAKRDDNGRGRGGVQPSCYRCRRIQKRKDRSGGKISVRLVLELLQCSLTSC